MTRPTRILYASHQPECGGGEKSLLDLFRGLDRGRYQPLLTTSAEGSLSRRARQLDVPVHFVPMLIPGKLRKVTGLPRAASLLARLAREQRVALLHANSIHAGYSSVMARRSVPIPVVWHVRDMTFPWLARRALSGARMVIANSEATAGTLPPRLQRSRRVRVVYNGIDPSFFEPVAEPDALRRELRLPPATPLVAMAGRVVPWKGHEVFLRAAARLTPQFAEARFLVIGSDFFDSSDGLTPYEEDLRRLCADLGIADRVHFLGHRADMPRVLGGLDLLVHPSSSAEPFGRSIVEAQARGLPVVATNAGGIPEILEEGANGLLVPPRHPAALADGIATLLSDRELARRLGKEGRARAQERFTVDVHARAVERIYDSLLGEKQVGQERSSS